jgi:hypothetical protein
VNMVPNEIHLDTPKQVIIDIGRDQWSNPYNQELLKLLEEKVIEHGW